MARMLWSRDAHLPATTPMYVRFGDVPNCRIEALDVEFPTISYCDAQTEGWPNAAFASDLAETSDTSPWRPFVATMPGAELRGPDPAVYCNDLLVYQSLWDLEHFRRSHIRLDSKKHEPCVGADRAGSILSLWHGNYYHWLVDVLPRLGLLELTGHSALPVVTPARCSHFHDESLRFLGVHDRRLPFQGPRMTFQSLVWASSLDPIGFPSSRTASWLRKRFLDDSPPESERKRLYVRRTVRTIANESDVLGVLRPLGFETVSPEQLSFTDQVSLFSQAEAIVGCHGAGIANSVFARSGALVLELFQPGYVNLSTYRLARAAGMRYGYLVGQAAGHRGLEKNRNVFVTIRDLESFLHNCL